MTRTALSPFLTGLAALAMLLLATGPAAAQDNAAGTWRPPALVDAVASYRVGDEAADEQIDNRAPERGATRWPASPFVYRDCVYWVNPAGAARCLAPESGAVRWTHRLPASIWATPLGHQDHVYFFTDEGVTQVLQASAGAPEIVATNHLSVDAPVTGFAAVDDAIVIRAGTEVIRVGRAVE